ncbi:MAG: diaminopimelate dehydrogenase [Candidatus Omnitrophica bacterium]|nr:diaminopimelate dehydrogenase [Candidatus Omnitrophota bacterium]
MDKKIKIGIVGYGNVGKGVELAIEKNSDMKLEAIFTRRDSKTLKTKGLTDNVFNISEAVKFKNNIDVLILCGGSATDLPKQGPYFAGMFNIVDSFDTHAKIPEYFSIIDKEASIIGKVSLIATGWDPGLFSMLRLIEESVLPDGKGYTFWGKGVSQGHSDAVRRLKGVSDARQYTIPIDSALKRVRAGENPEFCTKDKHLRDCYVVAEEGADLERIKKDIVSMPNYFADYVTNITFITKEEMDKNHSKMPHGGLVLRSGNTGVSNKQIIEFSLTLDSNPEFTGSVLAAYARAVYRLYKEGQKGAKTVFDIAPKYLSQKTYSELLKDML